MRKAVWIGFVFILSVTAQDKFAELLSLNRYPLTLDKGRLAGKGADAITSAIANAQFVMVGEQHAVTEVPQFVGALCDALGSRGFHTMAVEAGPLAARNLETWVRDPGGRAKLIDFEKKFPDSIAFFNMDEEYGLLERCAHAASGGVFHLWGLDQEFMGATGLLLTQIAEAHASEPVRKEALRLLELNNAALAKAQASGNPGELFMLSGTDDDFKQLQAPVRQSHNPAAQNLADELVESRAIYMLNATSGFQSNRRRALLMKHHFMTKYAAETTPPKVLLKFGDWHLYAGFNPLHNNDIGNTITELADGRGTESVSFAVLGAGGTALRFAGIGKPYVIDKFQMLEDKDYAFMKPFVDASLKDGWTLFDLRSMRRHAAGMSIGTDMERLVFGYDFLVLVPEMTASRQLR